MPKRRASKDYQENVPSAEEQTTPSPLEQKSKPDSATNQAVEYTPATSGPVDQSQSSAATTANVDTSGLVLVDKAWMQAMELTVKSQEERIQSLLKNGTPQGPNGHNGKPWYEIIADVAGKIIDKIPVGVTDPDASIVNQIGREVVVRAAQQTGVNVPFKPALPAQVPPAGN